MYPHGILRHRGPCASSEGTSALLLRPSSESRLTKQQPFRSMAPALPPVGWHSMLYLTLTGKHIGVEKLVVVFPPQQTFLYGLWPTQLE